MKKVTLLLLFFMGTTAWGQARLSDAPNWVQQKVRQVSTYGTSPFNQATWVTKKDFKKGTIGWACIDLCDSLYRSGAVALVYYLLDDFSALIFSYNGGDKYLSFVVRKF